MTTLPILDNGEASHGKQGLGPLAAEIKVQGYALMWEGSLGLLWQ